MTMRHGDKGVSALSGEDQLYGVDFHDRIQKGQKAYMIELGSECGIASQDIKKLKRQLERN